MYEQEPRLNRPADKAPGSEFGSEYFVSWVYKPTSMYWWSTRYYEKIIRRFSPGKRIIEIGCGLGHLLGRLEPEYETFGVDLSRHAVRQTRVNAPGSVSLVTDIQGTSIFPEAFFDCVIAKHVVEHLADPPAGFRSVARLLRPGGVFLFMTPNTAHVFRERKGDSWHALKDPTHISLKAPDEWRAIAEAAGFRIRRLFGDGLWDVPYFPFIPRIVQGVIFGLPAALQVLTGTAMIPVRCGESAIFVAEKTG